MKFVVFCLFLLISQVASACSCLRFEGTLEEQIKHYYKNSENVFSALITSSTIDGTPSDFAAVNSSFHVLKTYRGNPNQWNVLTTEGNNGTSCTSRLVTGDQYLFFIDRNRVGHCSWVVPIYGPYEEKQYKEILESLIE